MARTKKERKADAELLTRIRKRYSVMVDADKENRRRSKDDLEFAFVPGKQWDDSLKLERGDRPCFEFNKIRPTIKRVVNEMRRNRPQGKVRAVEDGDKDTADIYDGLCRNIWNISDGDTVIDYAGEYQVAGGMGAWRIVTEYSSDTAFDQEIYVKPIKNPFCLYADPACADPIKRDARDWILTDKIPRTVFEEKYKDAEVVEFDVDTEFDDDEEWQDDETVRIAEYWWREPETKTIYLLQGGQTVDTLDGIDPALVVRSREVQCHKIMMCIASGDAILEGPKPWAGKEFPFVLVYGDWLVIDGKTEWSGLTRHAKDAQRSYNFARTAISETIALAPQAKWWATPDQALGHLNSWAESHKKNFPVNLYNPDAKAPGAPQRMGGADVPVALIQESQLASEEIKAVTGIFDASLGAQSNETSGRAIMARQSQGEAATFNYADNLAKGIRRTYEILIDLIPKIYDTERSVRILGIDGAEKYAKVNQVVVDPATLQQTVINDLARGKYDVTVTVGPSFSTQRQEAAETYTNLMSAMPNVAPLFADLAVKSMDLPYANEVADRLKAAIPPGILPKDGEKPLPPEAMQVMQQAEVAMQQVQQQTQLVQQAAQEVEQGKAEVEKGKSELQTMLANLETKRAQFEAQVAKAVADVQVKEAGLAVKQAQSQSIDDKAAVEGEKQMLTQAAAEAMQGIQQLTEQFMQVAAGVLDQVQQVALQKEAPKPKVTRIDRVPGPNGVSFVPVYEDTAA